MPISTHDAAAALDTIAQAQRRAKILRGYEYGAPHLILWAGIWFLGYGLSDLIPEWTNVAWLVLDSIGIAGSFWLGMASKTGTPATARHGRQYFGYAATLVGLNIAILYVLRPSTSAQIGALPALIAAAIYTGVGISRGVRWLIAGVALGLLTLVGFAALNAHFLLWMSVVGGSTLLLTGLWLRRA